MAQQTQRMILPVFSLAIFVGAMLVFLIQPMVTKMVLPLFGGTPAVWNTATLFFQALLLAGYSFAHFSIKSLGLRRQPVLQLLLLALPLLTLPIGITTASSPPADLAPAFWLLGLLLMGVAAPYFVVTTASPVLQRWFAATDHPAARDPYFLYAAGNAGSLLGLLGYPLLLEPNLPVAGQSMVWSGGYALFAVLVIACFLVMRNRAAVPRQQDLARPQGLLPPDAPVNLGPSPRLVKRLIWVGLAFIPSSLMLGATGFLSTDIAAVPLLWVLPLSIYLLTFILAFARRSFVSVAAAARVLPFLILGVYLTLVGVINPPIWALIVLHLATLFVAAQLCHGLLAAQRPASDYLTEFYLFLSIGGVLGGFFNALVAPAVFDSLLEYPLVLVLALLVRPGPLPRPTATSRLGWTRDFLVPLALYLAVLLGLVAVTRLAGTAAGVASLAVLAAGGAITLLFVRRPVRFALSVGAVLAIGLLVGGPALFADRTFFGVHRVRAEGDLHLLTHGTTVHGAQRFEAGAASEPLSYYSRQGPAGQIFEAEREGGPGGRRVGMVGLGSGALAAYGQPGDSFRFFEIDPVIARIATDPSLFTFLRDSGADVDVVIGDGRLSMAREPDGTFDLIVLDAFSSDAIPVHLLTREAIQLYVAKLQPEGVLAIHISNRYLDLESVVAGLAVDLALPAVAQDWEPPAGQAVGEGIESSHWVVLATDRASLMPIERHGNWREIRAVTSSPAWTDDFSNIVTALDWAR